MRMGLVAVGRGQVWTGNSVAALCRQKGTCEFEMPVK